MGADRQSCSAKTSRAWWHLSTIQQRVGSASVLDAYLVPSPPNPLFISAKLPASRSLTHQEEKHEAHACQLCSAEKYKAARVAPRTVGLKSFLKQFLGDSAREQKKKKKHTKTHKNLQNPWHRGSRTGSLLPCADGRLDLGTRRNFLSCRIGSDGDDAPSRTQTQCAPCGALLSPLWRSRSNGIEKTCPSAARIPLAGTEGIRMVPPSIYS